MSESIKHTAQPFSSRLQLSQCAAKLVQERIRHKQFTSHFVGPSYLFRFSLEQASLRTEGVTVFCARQLFARSSLPICQTQKQTKKSQKHHQGG
jgi:hypothetical protein